MADTTYAKITADEAFVRNLHHDGVERMDTDGVRRAYHQASQTYWDMPTEPVKFERGQLILAPYKGKDVLWAVTSVAKSGKAKLTAHFGVYVMDITTTVSALPDDWSVVSNGEAVYALTGVTDGEVVADAA